MNVHDNITTSTRHSAEMLLDGVDSIDWLVETNDADAVRTDVVIHRSGDAHILTATVRASREVVITAGLRFALPQGFAVAMHTAGVVQRVNESTTWATSQTALESFYTMDRQSGSVAIVPQQPVGAVSEWIADQGTAVTVLVVADVTEAAAGVRAGSPSLTAAVHPERLAAGESRMIRVRVAVNADPFPLIHEHACELPEPRDVATHAIALWGSQVPSLGTLEVTGSAYPTINLPRREYGTLHTFFDPDAWSVVASLSYSGVDALRAQARDVIERSLSHITPEGLVPHHFDGEEPTFVAISGSPQPGPNIFLIEASIDHACATGDFTWLAGAWQRGLRAACSWLLAQRDESGMLRVEGALWVDVFRRRGRTLDTNAMVVRTFARAAQLARYADDDLVAELLEASTAAREGLQALWAGDHFVTSVDPETAAVDDHVDAENYLAVAVGAASVDQAQAIVGLFDGAPQTHPGGRGTWVSLRRYDGEDCYLHNTGDSDIAMARLWWADLLARRAQGDRARFTELYEAVRSDLLELVWMRERYAAGGHMTRARGYHEYPGILDMMLREGICGIALDVLSADISPMRSGPFVARFGEVRLEYSQDRVVVELPGDAPRTVTVHGLVAAHAYSSGKGAVVADENGTVRVEAQPSVSGVRVQLDRLT